MVIDTSALLAIFFNEEHGAWAKEQLKKHQAALLMSTVNFAEVLILLKDRKPETFVELEKEMKQLPIRFIPPTISQARQVAEARLNYPVLNFGDCFAYALAKEKKCPILSLDSDFKKSDAQVLMP